MSGIVQALVDLYHLPDRFNASNGRKLLDSYPDYPVYATVLYIAMVFYLPGFLKKRNWYCELKWVTALWNLGLSLISTVGAYYTIQLLYEYVFVERGFYGSVCVLHVLQDGTSVAAASTIKNGYAQAHAHALSSSSSHSSLMAGDSGLNGTHIAALKAAAMGGSAAVAGNEPTVHAFLTMSAEERGRLLSSAYVGRKVFYIALFLYLKTPELLDTFFLIVQNKPVSFLHWFHHILTAIYSWHCGYTLIPAGVFFSTMNYTVHSIMYFYYFLVVLGYRRKIRWFAPVITMLQCLQMFGGVGITCYTYFQYWLGPAHKQELFYRFFHLVLSGLSAVQAQAASYMATRSFLSWHDLPGYKMEDHFFGCDTDATNLRMGVMMYSGYCVLFVKLFNELYLSREGGGADSLVLKRKRTEEKKKGPEDHGAVADAANGMTDGKNSSPHGDVKEANGKHRTASAVKKRG